MRAVKHSLAVPEAVGEDIPGAEAVEVVETMTLAEAPAGHSAEEADENKQHNEQVGAGTRSQGRRKPVVGMQDA